MIALALMAATAPLPPVEDEIVVIARRLEQAAAIVGKDARGRFTCALTLSSGSQRLDERLCRTAGTCVAKGASDNDAVRACIDRRKPQLLTQFRDEWKRGLR